MPSTLTEWHAAGIHEHHSSIGEPSMSLENYYADRELAQFVQWVSIYSVSKTNKANYFLE